jgi:HD-like signal output (HDOD) protein
MNASFSHDLFDADTSPAALERIAALASDLDSAPKEWVAALGLIPAVSARMLQVINAAYAQLPGRIVSIHHAIVFLGFNTVKNLASRLVLPAVVNAARDRASQS